MSPPTTVTSARRRREIVLAGHRGDAGTARRALADPDALIRATALGALRRAGVLRAEDIASAAEDSAALVRSRAAEEAAGLVATGSLAAAPTLIGLLGDQEPLVVESACFALGEMGEHSANREAVEALVDVAANHRDPLCREAAVAALGALGDEAGLPTILAATSDKPAVRRRAVLALAPFSGPDVEAALSRALEDRDWQVRQAAEDLGGRPFTS